MKYSTLVLCCLFSFVLNAQSDNTSLKPDQRLYAVYEATYIDQLLVDNPFLIQRWNYYLDHAFDLVDEANAKTTDRPVVHIADIQQINILLLEKEQHLKHDFNKTIAYKIANSSQLLIYKSGKQFNKLFKAHLERE